MAERAPEPVEAAVHAALGDDASATAAHAMADEIHVAGLLAHVAPTHLAAVTDWLASEPEVELHGEHGSKLVIVIERTSAQAVMSFVDTLRERPGVYNVALVYQHTENAEDMEEMIDVDHA